MASRGEVRSPVRRVSLNTLEKELHVKASQSRKHPIGRAFNADTIFPNAPAVEEEGTGGRGAGGEAEREMPPAHADRNLGQADAPARVGEEAGGQKKWKFDYTKEDFTDDAMKKFMEQNAMWNAAMDREFAFKFRAAFRDGSAVRELMH